MGLKATKNFIYDRERAVISDEEKLDEVGNVTEEVIRVTGWSNKRWWNAW